MVRLLAPFMIPPIIARIAALPHGADVPHITLTPPELLLMHHGAHSTKPCETLHPATVEVVRYVLMTVPLEIPVRQSIRR